jgi:hypothetical protein
MKSKGWLPKVIRDNKLEMTFLRRQEMKRLAVLCVLAAVLGICSQSYGDVFVYNVSGTVKAIDTTTGNASRTAVRGVLAVDMNVSNGNVTDENFVLYGNNAEGNGVYVVANIVNAALYGTSLAVVINTEASGDQTILTGNKNNGGPSNGGVGCPLRQWPGMSGINGINHGGRWGGSDINDANWNGRPGGHDINDANCGFPSRNKAFNALGALGGSMQIDGGILFDANQSLVGNGDITATLDPRQTKNASTNRYSVGDVVNNIIVWLEGLGYTEF